MKLESFTTIKIIIISNDDNNNDNDNDDTMPLANFDNTVLLASFDHTAPLASSGKYNLFFILNFETYITDDYIIFLL